MTILAIAALIAVAFIVGVGFYMTFLYEDKERDLCGVCGDWIGPAHSPRECSCYGFDGILESFND